MDLLRNPFFNSPGKRAVVAAVGVTAIMWCLRPTYFFDTNGEPRPAFRATHPAVAMSGCTVPWYAVVAGVAVVVALVV